MIRDIVILSPKVKDKNKIKNKQKRNLNEMKKPLTHTLTLHQENLIMVAVLSYYNVMQKQYHSSGVKQIKRKYKKKRVKKKTHAG
jgi:hypothetical protein